MGGSLTKAYKDSGYSWNPSRRRRRAASHESSPESRGRRHVVTDPTVVIASMRANGFGKRLFDIIAAAGGLIALSPLLLGVALLIKLRDGGTALYGHPRIGRQGRVFRCWKFRSMVASGGEALLAEHFARCPAAEREWRETQKLADDPRVTRIGAFIRKTSIDELPQFFNVLKGDMSLVGPRPPIPYEAAQYQPWHLRRVMTAKPGITGLWQVEGRSRVSFSEMVRMDVRYIRDCSLALDLKLLFKTILVVIRCDGAG